MEADEVITVSDLRVTLAGHEVVRGLSFNVRRGEIVGLVGASGSGKTVLLRTMLGLLPKTSGTVEIMGVRLEQATPAESRRIGGRCGMMFQQGALFSSLTLRENVEFPMREYLDGSDAMYGDVALAKLAMVGLTVEDADKLPSEISGGMTKRVAIARALALDPDILFLDEPTSGLDPIAAGEIDRLIRTLQRVLNLTVFMVTHDLNSLKSVCTRILALYDGRIIAQGAMRDMLLESSAHNWAMETQIDKQPMPWAEKDMMIVLGEADRLRLSLPLCGTVKEVIKGIKIERGDFTGALAKKGE